MTPAEFFYENAGYSYCPTKETQEEGRQRCAKELAEAEELAAEDYTFEWSEDPDIDSSNFSDEDPPWTLWVCCMVHDDGTVVQSLHGIDFGRDGDPWGSDYRRVVEAELALEHFNEEEA